MIVKENIDFKQNQNPYKAMTLGSHRPYKIDDRLKSNKDLSWRWGEWELYSKQLSGKPDIPKNLIGSITYISEQGNKIDIYFPEPYSSWDFNKDAVDKFFTLL